MLLISDHETTTEEITDIQICPSGIHIIVQRKTETGSAIN